MKYSQELVKEIQDCWKKEHSQELTEDTANEYLDSFARLFLAFAKEENKNISNLI
jgi:hypothetical protein